MTLEEFNAIVPNNPYAEQWVEALNKILTQYDITTPLRIAAFMGECCVESTNFTAIQENLNYKAESLHRTWPSHFETMEIAEQYAHKPEAIANRAYANRMGNGDEASGDGWKYCGRGLIQLTGKDNYQAFADSLQMNVEDTPAYMATFEGAVQSACYFWGNANLNSHADAGNIDQISHIINGGTLGQEERRQHYQRACQILGA
jgi:putative chitinase